MNDNVPYNYQPNPINQADVVGYDLQGNRRIRVRVPKRQRNIFDQSLSTTADAKIPTRIIETDTSIAIEVPKYHPPQKEREIPQPSQSQPYSYTTQSQNTTTETKNNITPEGSYVNSYSTFSTDVTLITNTVPPEQSTGTYSTMMERPNGPTRVRVKVRKNKDGSRTVIGPAPQREPNSAFNSLDPQYRDRELPPRAQNDRIVEEINGEKLKAIDSQEVKTLDLKVNHAVPYQHVGVFNAVSGKKITNPGPIPENYRADIPYNSRFIGNNDTTTMDSNTTLESQTIETQESTNLSVVSRDLPTYWQSEKDIDEDFIKLEIGHGTYEYLNDEMIRGINEEKELQRIQDEENEKMRLRELEIEKREIAKRQQDWEQQEINEREGTPWMDLFNNKKWMFIPRNRRMHQVPITNVEDDVINTDVSYDSGNLTAYGIYMPDNTPSCQIPVNNEPKEENIKPQEVLKPLYGEISSNEYSTTQTSSTRSEYLDLSNLNKVSQIIPLKKQSESVRKPSEAQPQPQPQPQPQQKQSTESFRSRNQQPLETVTTTSDEEEEKVVVIEEEEEEEDFPEEEGEEEEKIIIIEEEEEANE
ncbi:hypothetical protein TVAG_469900 [Trichomonas vaginalis G3]|uniref:Uncharacterized protein n=1 Tax=Trichomonas vaginalis (strain ATCC PRA-98 / G3) TaxID=412133 RepID=A2FW06_TRIV3|nr:hypothetical protein TVAGG3_1021440 [Trichomonas vaginalis G3]EAX90915.1 hypothetical protein TVAG_469900 [Trichomonas vaginalis G3]KAI5492163.1 hypothetical protein TVAGG3_1021440 [Trichomonas vaginalis G3]|eukprot:XP_001303845.1 hypothetical protein [Trichomonas vaginalis G3]